MDNFVRTLSNYYSRSDFRKFQNSLAKDIYNTLETSYTNSEDEVKMVTKMCNKINGKTFEKLQFYTKKIHGKRSNVEFQNQNRTTTKELADMVIISLATRGRDIIYEKTAFIQNKKESIKNSWGIDQDQLYLLYNFPTFKGISGIFRRNFGDEVVFLNHSESLGNYALFQEPGEMTLLNALTVFKLQQGVKITFSDIRKFADRNSQFKSGLTFPLLMDHPIMDEMLFRYLKHFPKYGLPFTNLPFLKTSSISFNIYEFVRNWTLFNIGELVSVYGNPLDEDLLTFNHLILKEFGLDQFFNINNIERVEFEDDLNIIITHMNLDGK